MAKTDEDAPGSGGIFTVFQNPDLDPYAGSQAIAVPKFDYSGADAPVVAVVDLVAAAAEESIPGGSKSADSKEN